MDASHADQSPSLPPSPQQPLRLTRTDQKLAIGCKKTHTFLLQRCLLVPVASVKWFIHHIPRSLKDLLSYFYNPYMKKRSSGTFYAFLSESNSIHMNTLAALPACESYSALHVLHFKSVNTLHSTRFLPCLLAGPAAGGG